MGRPIKDRTGERYTRLTLVSFAGRKNRQTYWNVRCDCGEKVIARVDKLEAGKIKSCGCLWKEKREKNLSFHNLTPGMNGWHFSGRSEE